MKNQFFNCISCLLVVLFITVSAPSFANNSDKSAAKNSPVEVKYIGQENDQKIVEVSVNNPTGEELYVILKDEDGSYLYQKKFTDKSFTQRFRFAKPENDVKVIMSVISKDASKTHVFEINKVVKMVEDVVVKRIN